MSDKPGIYKHCEYLESKIRKKQAKIDEFRKQLQQRDEVIEEAIDVIDKMINTGYRKGLTLYTATGSEGEFACRAKIIKDILNKYKNKDEAEE